MSAHRLTKSTSSDAGRVRLDLAPALAFLVLVVLLGGDLCLWLLEQVAPGPAVTLATFDRSERMLFLGAPLAAAVLAILLGAHARRARRSAELVKGLSVERD